MTNYMLVRQPVADLAQFRRGFNELQPHRHEHGLTDVGQFLAADEPNTVIVIMEYADLSRAKEYWNSEVLAIGREKCGALGPNLAPAERVWLTDGDVE